MSHHAVIGPTADRLLVVGTMLSGAASFGLLIVILHDFVDALKLNGLVLRRLTWTVATILMLVLWLMVPELAGLFGYQGAAIDELAWRLHLFGWLPRGALAVALYRFWRALRSKVPPEDRKRRWNDR